MGTSKSLSRRKRTGNRNKGSGRNIPATPLNPKHHLIAWLNLTTTGATTASFTYKQLLALAEAQISTREIQTAAPTSTATVYNYVEVVAVEAWSSPFNNPTSTTTGGSYENIIGLDLTVGPTSAIMPRSTSADISVGFGDRAYTRVQGNLTTWGAKDSAAVAAVVDWRTLTSVANPTLPLTLKFHVNMW